MVIVGHGPSVVGKRLGSWLDTQRVVRLKHAERPNAEDWGTRTDYVCASSPSFYTDKAEFWWLGPVKKYPLNLLRGRRASPDWLGYWDSFRGPKSYPKPSTGLLAVFCAIEFLQPKTIGLLGFDMVLHPDVPTSKWYHVQGKNLYSHDAHAERRCLDSLGVEIVEL